MDLQKLGRKTCRENENVCFPVIASCTTFILRRRESGVSKDAGPSVASWFETALARLLTMRVSYPLSTPHHSAMNSAVAFVDFRSDSRSTNSLKPWIASPLAPKQRLGML
jgi:hypothetical protein